MIYQIQYRINGRCPTTKLISDSRQAWIDGTPLPEGVRVNPINWTGTIEGLRAALKAKKAYIGEAGIVKQYAAADMTLCDYDSPRRPPLHVIMRLAVMLKIKPLWIREDRTRHGWHMLIKWNRRFKPLELIAIQCILGSDVQREAYNLARVFSGKTSKRWNLLFERKL